MMSFTAVGNMLFQSIGESKKALFLSTLQNGLAFIPLIVILPNFLDLTGIQIAQPCATLITCCITLPLVFQFFKEMDEKVY